MVQYLRGNKKNFFICNFRAQFTDNQMTQAWNDYFQGGWRRRGGLLMNVLGKKPCKTFFETDMYFFFGIPALATKARFGPSDSAPTATGVNVASVPEPTPATEPPAPPQPIPAPPPANLPAPAPPAPTLSKEPALAQ